MSAASRGTEKWKPAVSKNTLLFIAGILWIAIGIMLVSIACSWLMYENKGHALTALIIGIICALLIHHFGFLRIVDKNLERILPLKGKKCVFSFMSWKSYIIVVVMVTMGTLLRHSAIPKSYLSVLYVGIGLSLILSSIRYLRNFVIQVKSQRQENSFSA